MRDRFRIIIVADLHRAPHADDYTDQEITESAKEAISGIIEDGGLEQFQIHSVELLKTNSVKEESVQ